MIRGHGLKIQALEVETFEGALDLVPEASIVVDCISQLRRGTSRYFELFFPG